MTTTFTNIEKKHSTNNVEMLPIQPSKETWSNQDKDAKQSFFWRS